MSDHRGFTREEAETEAGRIRGVIVDEVGKRCGSPPDVHPRLLEGIEVAARLLAERASAAEETLARVEAYRRNCAIMRTEPSTAGLRKALDGPR